MTNVDYLSNLQRIWNLKAERDEGKVSKTCDEGLKDAAGQLKVTKRPPKVGLNDTQKQKGEKKKTGRTGAGTVAN